MVTLLPASRLPTPPIPITPRRLPARLLPDVIDKTGSWVFHVFPKGRWLAHGLPFFAAVSALVFATQERRKARGFILGYLGHPRCDLWGGGRVPWFAPFEHTARSKGRTPFLVPTLKSHAAGDCRRRGS